MRLHLPVSLIALFLCVLNIAPAWSSPKVVVSINPIHSLATQVMAGIATPELLLKGPVDPHSQYLKPSQATALNQADLIVVVSPALETFLGKSLHELQHKKKILVLSSQQGMTLYRSRKTTDWGTSEGKNHEQGTHQGRDNGTHDPHLWLDPDNARQIVKSLVTALSMIDEPNAQHYSANGKKAMAKIIALDNRLRTQLAPVRKIPYLVFHDGYHYFEAHYGLNAIGALILSAQNHPGARRLRQLRKIINRQNVGCVFAEPQFSTAMIATMLENTRARPGVLDLLGSTIKPGANAYGEMMIKLATSLKSCLLG